MSIIRKAQLITLFLSAGIGLAVLFTLDKVPALATVDTLLSKEESGSITPGSVVEDPHPENKRQRVFRKVFAPNTKAPDYLYCNIDDDPDEINAYGIYHPADLAITLKNLRKLNMRSVFITTHLQWPELEEVELNALSSAISQFDYATIATPVKRTVKGDPMPDYFFHASLPISEVKGSTSSLPKVNKLSLAPNITIPENTLAGFSIIESEEAVEDSIPMMATWDDRVIFYAPLLEHLQHLGLKPADLSIEIGKCIRLGNHGNIIPIDEFGRLHTDYRTSEAPFTIVSAYSGETSMIGITQTAAILGADGEKSSAYSSLTDSYNALAQVTHTPTVGEKSVLTRFPLWLEAILIIDLAALAAWLLAYRSARRQSVFIISLFALGGLIFALNRFTPYWSPSAPYLITLLTGWLLTSLLAKPVRKKLLAAKPVKTEPSTPGPAPKFEQKVRPKEEVPQNLKTEAPEKKPEGETKSIALPKPKKENIHTGKHPEHEFEGEFIPEEATMFATTVDSKTPQEKTETKNSAGTDTLADEVNKSAPQAEPKAEPGKITSKVKIDTSTEYPFFPVDPKEK